MWTRGAGLVEPDPRRSNFDVLLFLLAARWPLQVLHDLKELFAAVIAPSVHTARDH